MFTSDQVRFAFNEEYAIIARANEAMPDLSTTNTRFYLGADPGLPVSFIEPRIWSSARSHG